MGVSDLPNSPPPTMPLTMKNTMLVLCFGLALGIVAVNAGGCRFPEETKEIFRIGGRRSGCQEMVTEYPRFTCFNRFISVFKCCRHCSAARAQGRVACRDAPKCVHMPRSGCGSPKTINACPKKCGKCPMRG